LPTGKPKAPTERPGRDPVVLLVAATILLLPVLAVLQVRWLERWSASERERMRSTLVAGVFLLGEEVDRAVAAVSETLDVSDVPPGERAAALEARLVDWRERSPYPGLVGAVELAESPAPPLPDPSAADGARLVCGDAGAGRPVRLVLPIPSPVGAAEVAGTLGEAGPATAWVVVALDEHYLLEQMFPRLVSFFFTARDPSAEVTATVTERGGTLLAAYPSGRPLRPLESVDAAYNVLSLRIRNWLALGAADGIGGAPEDRGREPPGCWTIRVAHRAGSLDAAVGALRRRQMVASFVVLALLGLTAGALAVAARRASRLGRQQLAFVAGVTHELRTPLSVIRTAGDNLAKRVVTDGDGVAEYGRLIRSEGRRLSEMVENVLRLSRVIYGGDGDAGAGRREPVAAGDVIAAAVEECRALCEERDVRVVVDDRAGSARPALVDGDREALVCALRNLLANAVKYGPQRQTVRIEVGVGSGVGSAGGPEAGRGRTVRIAVTDQGEGIPPADRERVLAAFYRGETARKQGVPGAGLGLALVHEVAELHGGRVEIDGRTVALVLPAAGAAPGPVEGALQAPAEEGGDA